MNLVPLKIKIGKRENGSAKYPDFNRIKVVQDLAIDWSVYIDSKGTGWHYDKTSSHSDNTVDSPFGQQFGSILIPKEFADEAIDMFPEECTILTEEEFEDFYDNKAHVKDSEEIIDEGILTKIKLKKDLGLKLTAEQEDAIDIEKEQKGITKNKNKKWKDYKLSKGIKIVK